MLWAHLIPGIEVQNFSTALLAALVMGMINLFVRPVLLLLTLPLTILTLGLFLIVLNVLLVFLAAWLTPGFSAEGFLPTLLFGFLLGITQSAIEKALEKES